MAMKTYLSMIMQLVVSCGIVFFLVMMAQARPMPDTVPGRCAGDTGSPGYNGNRPAPDDNSGDAAPAFLRGIVLTDAQQDAISGILHAQAREVRARKDSIRTAQESLHALVASDRYDGTQARSLARSMTDDLAAMLMLHAESDHRIYTLLTPDQRRHMENRDTGRDYRPACSANGKSRAPVLAL